MAPSGGRGRVYNRWVDGGRVDDIPGKEERRRMVGARRMNELARVCVRVMVKNAMDVNNTWNCKWREEKQEEFGQRNDN